MAEAYSSEEELGDLERIEVSSTACFHVRRWEEVVSGEHAQHQGQPTALQEVVLEVAGVLTQSGTGWHQQSINNLQHGQNSVNLLISRLAWDSSTFRWSRSKNSQMWHMVKILFTAVYQLLINIF